MNSQEKISNEKGNWYIVEIIEKLEPVLNKKSSDLRRVTTWGNHHLIKASSPDKALEKAIKLGKEGEFKFINSDKIEMEYIFIGIADLIPIYENIEDGAEIMWTNYGFISERRTQKLKRTKAEILRNILPKK